MLLVAYGLPCQNSRTEQFSKEIEKDKNVWRSSNFFAGTALIAVFVAYSAVQITYLVFEIQPFIQHQNFTKIKRKRQILHNLTFSLLTGVAGFDNPMRDVGSEETIRQIAQVDSKTVYDEENDGQDEEWHDDDQDEEKDDKDVEDLEDDDRDEETIRHIAQLESKSMMRRMTRMKSGMVMIMMIRMLRI